METTKQEFAALKVEICTSKSFWCDIMTSSILYILQYPPQLHLAMMETFAWRILLIHIFMETISMEVEWKCAITAPTVQCVMRVGLTVMLLLSVTTMVMAIHTIVSAK